MSIELISVVYSNVVKVCTDVSQRRLRHWDFIKDDMQQKKQRPEIIVVQQDIPIC